MGPAINAAGRPNNLRVHNMKSNRPIKPQPRVVSRNTGTLGPNNAKLGMSNQLFRAPR